MIGIIKKEWLFFIFFALFLFLYLNFTPTLKEINSFIDWSTIRALSALLLIITAFKISNTFDYFSNKIVIKFYNERILAFAFVFLSLFLSMFLTNDITLFIVVPITLAFSNHIKNDLTKLIIFEAIAVNVGSTLTPFGNPQNIFLFRQMDISVFEFIKNMAYIFIPMFLLLMIFTAIIFPKKELNFQIAPKTKYDKFLFLSSLILFILFIFSLEFSFVRYTLPFIIIFYLFFKREVFFKFDYFLILTFIVMFMDFGMLSKSEIIKHLMSCIKMNFLNVFNLSVILSQIISNVPAAIFMSNFSNNYLAIAYGVNIAANGIIIGSLANIIALRFLKDSSVYLKFHKYSIPYFLLSYILIIGCYLF